MKHALVWGTVLLALGGLRDTSGQPQTKGKDKEKTAEKNAKSPPRQNWRAPLGSVRPNGVGVPPGGATPQGPKAVIEHRDQVRGECRGNVLDDGCEGGPIPAAGGNEDFRVLSAARFVGEDPRNPGAFIFEYDCSDPSSYVEVRITAEEGAGIAPRNLGANLVEHCDRQEFEWRPAESRLTANFPGLEVLMVEHTISGLDRIISPVIRAKTSSPQAAHHLKLRLPGNGGGTVLVVPSEVNGPAIMQEMKKSELIPDDIDLESGEYRIYYIRPEDGTIVVPFSILVGVTKGQNK